MYEENIDLLKKAVENRSFIRNISKHRNPDGSLDIEGNKVLWNKAMGPFAKIKLWENGTPGYDDRDTLQGEPYMVFIPAPEKEAVRGTVLVAHGGGFEIRTGCEGANTAYYFHKAGFNTAILSYRIKPYGRLDSMADMQRAIRLLRFHKSKLNITDKVAVMGFSAGGMICANCATHFDSKTADWADDADKESDRPDAAVVSYGAFTAISYPMPFMMMQGKNPFLDMMGATHEERYYLAPEKNVSPSSPPFFIWQTLSDDGRLGLYLAKALSDAAVPYELHIFQPGVHGLALADGENDLDMNIPHVTHWAELCSEWMKDLGI